MNPLEWSHTEFGFTTSPGRMIRTDRFKYTRYIEGDGEELYDMVDDPGETRTLIDDPAYADVLDEHRRLMDRHLAETGDDFESLQVEVDPRWRSHELGYRKHRGPSATMVAQEESGFSYAAMRARSGGGPRGQRGA